MSAVATSSQAAKAEQLGTRSRPGEASALGVRERDRSARMPRCDGLQAPEPGGLTLEDRILAAWEDLTGEGRAECPACGGQMRIAGGCEGCGSELG